jgi:hypothetical protein
MLVLTPLSARILLESSSLTDRSSVEELQKKKQSDVLRFLLRVRCWEVRQFDPNPMSRIASVGHYEYEYCGTWTSFDGPAIHSLNLAESAKYSFDN